MGGFRKTCVKLGRKAIIVVNDRIAIEEAKEWLCWRALGQFTMSDLTIDDLPVGEVLQQLKELSDKVDCYGQGVWIQLGASVTEPQLAKRLTTELSGRGFDSQIERACNVAGHAVEWGGYENDCLLLDVRSRVDADGTLPESFELEEGIPVELVIHDGDDFKGVYIDLPRESEGGVSVWVDEEQRGLS